MNSKVRRSKIRRSKVKHNTKVSRSKARRSRTKGRRSKARSRTKGRRSRSKVKRSKKDGYDITNFSKNNIFTITNGDIKGTDKNKNDFKNNLEAAIKKKFNIETMDNIRYSFENIEISKDFNTLLAEVEKYLNINHDKGSVKCNVSIIEPIKEPIKENPPNSENNTKNATKKQNSLPNNNDNDASSSFYNILKTNYDNMSPKLFKFLIATFGIAIIGAVCYFISKNPEFKKYYEDNKNNPKFKKALTYLHP